MWAFFGTQCSNAVNTQSSKAQFDKHKLAETLFITHATLHNNYISLEIAQHSSPSDAWYLDKVTQMNGDLFLYAIYTKIFRDISVCVFGQGTKGFKQNSIESEFYLTEAFASVPQSKIGKHLHFITADITSSDTMWPIFLNILSNAWKKFRLFETKVHLNVNELSTDVWVLPIIQLQNMKTAFPN